MIKFAIVDDEKVIASKIHRILSETIEKRSFSYRTQIFNSGEEFLQSKEFQDTDVVLLDIEIGDANGVELAKLIRELNDKIIVIFVTSHMNYIKESFGLNVFDYIDKSDLESELTKSLLKLMKEQNDNFLLSFVSARNQISINVLDIKVVALKQRKLVVETKKEKYDVASMSLKDFHKKLNENFIFINSDIIVNLKYVKSISDQKITLDTKEIYPISSRKYKDVRDKFNDYQIEKGKKWL